MRDLSDISSCPNCGFELPETPFCPNCGQRKLTEKDLNIRSLAGDFFEGLLNFENSVLSTLRDFLLHPSRFINRYNEGARKKYLSPIKLFLIANAFYFLFPAINTFTTSLQIQLNGLIYSDFIKGFIEARIAASEMGADQFYAEYNELTATLSKALLLFLPLLFGCAFWLTRFIKHDDTPLLFHINRSLVLHSFILLIVASIVPGIYFFLARILNSQLMFSLVTEFNLSLVSLIVINIYGYFLYRGSFRTNLWINTLRTVLLNVLYFFLIFLYRFFLLMVTLGWMALFRS